MEILERGKNWGLEVRCTGSGNGGGGCESLLRINKEDIYVTSNTDFVGDTDYFYTFRCPVCNVETDIADEKIPESVKRVKRLNYRERRY